MSYKSRTYYGTGMKECLRGCTCKSCVRKERRKQLKDKDKEGLEHAEKNHITRIS